MSLEEVDEVFGESRSFLDPPRVARAMRRRMKGRRGRRGTEVDEVEVAGKH